VHLTKALWALGVLSLAACAAGGSGAIPGADGVGRQAQFSRALPATSPSPDPAATIPPASAKPAACNGPNTDGKHHCHADKNPLVAPNPNPNPATVVGLTPADLRAAYGLPAAGTTTANGPIIAVIDAFDDPTAESDLAIYRARFGLPACGTANGCFLKLNQLGKTDKFPPANAGWGTEIALDLAMASAACPTCRIALVEANDDNIDNLSAIVDKAATLGPAAISNSYGALETAALVKANDAHYNHPGVPIVASAGDTRAIEFPASSKYVIAVTGSTLARDASTPRGWSERALSSGTGCSAVEAAPSWQQGRSACTTRAVGDIAFDADVSSGVAVYNTQDGGWEVLGGTSAGAPFVAGLYAAAANYGTSAGAQLLYANAARLNPVTPLASGPVTALGSPNGFAGL
jgi:subtilase family serine protease